MAILAMCGDARRDPGEQCDDGNTTNGDGCSGCTVDPGYTCPVPGMRCTVIAFCGDSGAIVRRRARRRWMIAELASSAAS